MRHQIVAGADLFVSMHRSSVNLGTEAPRLGFCAFWHFTVIQESPPPFPINERPDQFAAIHFGAGDIEMVVRVHGEMRGPSWRQPSMPGEWKLTGATCGARLVSASGQQWNQQQQGSHRVKGPRNHWFAHRVSPGFKGNLTVAHIRAITHSTDIKRLPCGVKGKLQGVGAP